VSEVMASACRLPVVRDVLSVAWRKGVAPVPPSPAIASVPTGSTLVCDLTDHTQRKMWLGIHEPEETAAVRRVVRRGDTVVDVGAHIGWYTVLLADLVGPAGAVIALEPFPQSFGALEQNVARNGSAHVTALRVAASDRSCTTTLGRQPDSDSGSVTIGHRGVEDLADVETRPLDEVLRETGEVALLKVDVEGHEAQVLAGADEVLARTQHVLIELNERALTASGSSGSAIRALLRDAGFASQRLLGGPRYATIRRHRSVAASFANLLASR
jgi:FkbM family methyltransferase